VGCSNRGNEQKYAQQKGQAQPCRDCRRDVEIADDAEVRAGATPDGTFRPVSKQATVSGRTTIALTPGTHARYFLVWITALSPASGPKFRADISAVAARGPLSHHG
jgi:hypothetical protein